MICEVMIIMDKTHIVITMKKKKYFTIDNKSYFLTKSRYKFCDF